MIRLYFPLSISLDSSRPIFMAYINGIPMKCMLDTGADTPVFCKGIELFKEVTKSIKGVSMYKSSSISGFGKNSENTVLWNFDKFQLSDKDGNSIIYKQLKLAVVKKPELPCDIILSASMFMKMKYTIDCSVKKQFLVIDAHKDILRGRFLSRKRYDLYIY